MSVSTLRSLTLSVVSNPKMIERIEDFDKFIYDRFGDPRNSLAETLDFETVKEEANNNEMRENH